MAVNPAIRNAPFPGAGTISPLSSSISIRKIAVCAAVAALVLLVPVTADFTAAVRFTGAIGILMALLWLTEAVPCSR